MDVSPGEQLSQDQFASDAWSLRGGKVGGLTCYTQFKRRL